MEAALKGVKDRLSEAQSGLVQLMGEYLLADRDGVQVLRYRQRGGVDYPAVLETIAPNLDPQVLETHRRPSTTRVKVTLKAGAEAEEGAATDGAQSTPANPKVGASSPKGRRRQGATSVAAGSAYEADIVFGYF